MARRKLKSNERKPKEACKCTLELPANILADVTDCHAEDGNLHWGGWDGLAANV